MTSQTYDPGPVPDEQPATPIRDRAHAVAAIHALAEWVRTSTDPVPNKVMLTVETTSRDEVDESLRVAPVLTFAHAAGTTAYECYSDVWTAFTIMDPVDCPIRGTYYMSARKDHGSDEPRYVR